MNQPHHIRSARQDDLPGIRHLLADCQLPADGVEDWIDKGYCVVEEQIGIIGIAGVEPYPPCGLLRSVAVSPGRRGNSIGETLIKDRLAWARAMGLSQVYLITVDADLYFKRFGFKAVHRENVPAEIRRSAEFSSICPETAIVMVKSLTDEDFSS